MDHAVGNAMAKRSGGEKVSGPPRTGCPYHAAISELSIRIHLSHLWEICARLGHGRYGYSGQSQQYHTEIVSFPLASPPL